MKKNRVISLILVLVILLSTFIGCKENKANTITDKKGGYTEIEHKLPEEGMDIIDIKLLNDNTLALLGYDLNYKLIYYKSKDGGESWNKENSDKLQIGDGEEYSYISINSDGSIIISYITNLNELKLGEDLKNTRYRTIKYSNNEEITELKIDNNYLSQSSNFIVSENENIFLAIDDGHSIVQINAIDGKLVNTYDLNEEYFQNYYIVQGYLVAQTTNEFRVYNIKDGKLEKRKEISEKEFVFDIFAGKDKDFMYYYTTKGVYEYNLENGSSEKIIDSEMCKLVNPDVYIYNMIRKGNGEYIFVYFLNGKYELVSYKYLEDIKLTDKDKITVYSLYYNSLLEKSISLYNMENRNVIIKYEVGISEEGRISKTEALKILNTELMSGNGPDIILFDHINYKEYIDRGILENFNDVIDEYKDSIYKNVYDNYNEDGIYVFPLRINIPYINGYYVDNINDLKSFAKVIQEVNGNSRGNIMDIYYIDELIYLLYNSSVESWINEDNSINNKNIKEYLKSIKMIYDVTIAKQSDENIKLHEKKKKIFIDDYGENGYLKNMYLNRSLSNEIYMYNEDKHYDIGYLNSIYSLNDIEGYNSIKNTNIKLWQGQVGKHYLATLLIGINKNSKNIDVAKDLVKSLFSDKAQKLEDNYGFSVNKNICKMDFNNNIDLRKGEFSVTNEKGEIEKCKTIELSNEYIEEFINTVESLNVSVENNTDILEQVKKYIKEYLEGSKTLNQTLKAIEDKLEVYLSE